MAVSEGLKVRQNSVSVFFFSVKKTHRYFPGLTFIVPAQESRCLGLGGSGCRRDAETVPSGTCPTEISNNRPAPPHAEPDSFVCVASIPLTQGFAAVVAGYICATACFWK